MEKIALFALGITFLAGLSTCLGALLVFFTKHTNKRLISLALGFSAGVMVFISFTEIFPEASELIASSYGGVKGYMFALLSFLGGIIMMALVGKLFPSEENPHRASHIEDRENKGKANEYKKLHRIGLFTAVALAIHNFPEGLVTFITNMEGASFGIPIAIAIAIHNIPEGIAISLPIYYATKSRIKSFGYAFLAGIAEPIGALIGYLFLREHATDLIVGVSLATVAGIMVFISFDELFPAAREYGKHGEVLFGLVAGMMVMGVSIALCA